jgi:hypothetical protein
MDQAYARQEANRETVRQSQQLPGWLANERFLRILHVDDDLLFLEVSKQILSMDNNFEVESVASVDEALKKCKRKLTM